MSRNHLLGRTGRLLGVAVRSLGTPSLPAEEFSLESPRQRAESHTDRVARLLREDIEAGRLRDGQVLPPTPELARQFGVSVFTIDRAMRLLGDLVVSKKGSGRVVNAPGQHIHREVRLSSPHVLLVGGYAGSGKTELGRILARETGWSMIDKDTVSRPAAEVALEVLGSSPHDRESDTYVRWVRPCEYEALMDVARENVECGNSVIVTAPFMAEFPDVGWIDRTTATFAALGAATTLVWVYCDEDTMITYLRRRGAARDTWKLAHWQEYRAKFDIEFRPPVDHFVIDNRATARPLQLQARELLQQVVRDQEEARR